MTPASPALSRSAAPAAFWLSAALIALPLLQALPIDFDRSAPLVVLLPALWSGRHFWRSAVIELTQDPSWMRGVLILFGVAIVASIVFSAHPAPAVVCAASWLVLAAAGVIAGVVARADESASQQLQTGLALGMAAGAAIMWFLWLAGGREGVPLYAHHRIFGLHALVGALATTALAVRSSTAPQRRVWLIIGAINWGAVLWSGGRGPVLALAGGLGCWFLVCPRDRKTLFKTATLQLLAGLACSAAFWTTRPELGWWHAFARTAAAAQQGAVNVSALTSTRSEFWRESVDRALHSPWIGHGPDAYRFLTPKLDGQQPHNVVLQLWLDLGVLGALPALALLGGGLWIGWRCARRDPDAGVAPWVALLTGLTLAGLLDGIFYHVLTLLPVTIALGVILFAIRGSRPSASKPAGYDSLHVSKRTSDLFTVVASAALGGAILVLTFHAFLFHALTVAPPPPGPTTTAARLVRTFPSTTFGLWTWLDQWHRTNPDAALAWARWAQAHATNPAIFHIRAAQYLHVRGHRTAAIEELNQAEAKAHYLARPSIAEMRKTMSSAP